MQNNVQSNHDVPISNTIQSETRPDQVYAGAPKASSKDEQIIPDEVFLKAKHWRVGSLSMGLALLLSGVLLLVSQWKGTDVWDIALLWWPVIFILLGVEILVYLFVARKGLARLRYDVFSIFIVGCLGMLCLMLATFSSLGLTQEVRQWIGSTERTIELPGLTAAVGQQVERLVVQTSHPYLVKVDTTSAAELHVVASYRTAMGQTGDGFTEEAMQLKEVGEVLYLFIKEPPRKPLFQAGYEHLEVTVMAPQHLQIEVRDIRGNKRLME